MTWDRLPLELRRLIFRFKWRRAVRDRLERTLRFPKLTYAETGSRNGWVEPGLAIVFNVVLDYPDSEGVHAVGCGARSGVWGRGWSHVGASCKLLSFSL